FYHQRAGRHRRRLAAGDQPVTGGTVPVHGGRESQEPPAGPLFSRPDPRRSGLDRYFPPPRIKDPRRSTELRFAAGNRDPDGNRVLTPIDPGPFLNYQRLFPTAFQRGGGEKKRRQEQAEDQADTDAPPGAKSTNPHFSPSSFRKVPVAR